MADGLHRYLLKELENRLYIDDRRSQQGLTEGLAVELLEWLTKLLLRDVVNVEDLTYE